MSGDKQGNWFSRHKILTVIGVVVVLGIIGTALSGGGNNNSSTNNTQQPAPTTSTPQPQDETQPEEKKVTLAEFYEKVQNDQTKAQVNELAGGREPSNCSESQNEYIGKMEICSYGGFMDGGIVTVTFTNDKVSSKAKSEF